VAQKSSRRAAAKTVLNLPRIGHETARAIEEELVSSDRHGSTFHSLHEAYAVLLEEVEEVWDIAKQKRRLRSKGELRKELIQIAAMAIKALQSMENFVGGNV
jgi:hypothetical protein